ncbi:GTP cyclohydrolase I [Amycolatopsis magusensis]|uniref:GTP cyclohydrolase I n=1 Tax=Amycolatopsis magusensis TaxID=882444 RepID=UPI001AEB5846
MTHQVNDALDTYLRTRDSSCVVCAGRGCVAQHGVRKPGALMVTSSITGELRSTKTSNTSQIAFPEIP